MANYSNLKNIIDQVVRTNGQGEITGANLNQTLQEMVTSLGANYQYAGVATPSTNPGSPDQNVFYIATLAGTYTNFGGLTVPKGISVLRWNGSWSLSTLYTVDSGLTHNSDALALSGPVYQALSLKKEFYLDGYAISYTSTGGLGLYKHCIIPIDPNIVIRKGIHNNGLPLVMSLDKNNNVISRYNVGSSPTITEVEEYDISTIFTALVSENAEKIIVNIALEGSVQNSDFRDSLLFSFDNGGQRYYNKFINRFYFKKGDKVYFSISNVVRENNVGLSYYIQAIKYNGSSKRISGVIYNNGGNDTFIIDDDYDFYWLNVQGNEGIGNVTGDCTLQHYKPLYETDTLITNLEKQINGVSSNYITLTSEHYVLTLPYAAQAGQLFKIKVENWVSEGAASSFVVNDGTSNLIVLYGNGTKEIVLPRNTTSLTIRMNPNSGWTNVGCNVTIFSPTNINTEHIKEIENRLIGTKLCVGDNFPIVYGNRLELFKYSMTNEIIFCENTELVMNVNGSPSLTNTLYGRFRENAYFFDSANDKSNFTLSLKLRDELYNVCDEKSINIIPFAKKTSPATSKNVLIIGDSYTHINTWCQELKRRLVGVGGSPVADELLNINFIGSQSQSVPNEGYSGQSWGFFIGTNSPFYYNGGINVASYASAHGYSSIDYVIILLGANGNGTETQISTLINAFITYNPNVKILVGSNAMKYNPYGWGNSQGLPAGMHAHNWNGNWMAGNDLLKNVLSTNFSNQAFYVDIPSQCDGINNWGYNEVDANNRNSNVKVKQGWDNVHPANSMYYQIADAFYNAFHYWCL